MSDRLRAAATAFEALRERVVAGEPWPLSEHYGAEPESDWGPKEVLAHVAEMLAYWPDQIDRILAEPAGEAVPFGRVATDPGRIERIGRDRHLTAGELFDLVASEAAEAARRFDALDDRQRARLGLHQRLGELTVAAIAERFVVSHVDDHVAQLEAILAARG